MHGVAGAPNLPNMRPERGPGRGPGPTGRPEGMGPNRLDQRMLGPGRGGARPPPGMWGPRGPPPSGRLAWDNPAFQSQHPRQDNGDGGVGRPGGPRFYPSRGDADSGGGGGAGRGQDGSIPYNSDPSRPPWAADGPRGPLQQQQQQQRGGGRGGAGMRNTGMGVARGPTGGAPSLGRAEEGRMNRGAGAGGEGAWRPMDGDSQWKNELAGGAPPPPPPPPPPGAMWGPGGKGEGDGRIGPDGGMQG